MGSAGQELRLRSCSWVWISSKCRNCLAGSHLIPNSYFTANARNPGIDNRNPTWMQGKLFGDLFLCQSRQLAMLFENAWVYCNVLGISVGGVQCPHFCEASKVWKSRFRVKTKKSQSFAGSEYGLGSVMSSPWVHPQQADIFQTLRAWFPCTDGNLAWKVHSEL